MKRPGPNASRPPAVWLQFDCDEALGLASFRAAGPLSRSRIKHGRRKRTPSEIGLEDLMPVNMARQDGRKPARDGPPGDDAGASAEHEIRRAHRRSFDGLMKGQEANIGAGHRPPRALEHRRKSRFNEIAFAWKTRHDNVESADLQRNSSRMVDDVDSGMRSEERERNRRSLVVSRHHDHGDAGAGHAFQWLEGMQHQPGFHPASKEHVAAVHDEVDVAANGWFERARMP